MKNLLYFIMLFALPTQAQYTLTAIDNGYSVNGNFYPFNVTGLTAPTSDTTYAGLILLPNRTIVPLSKISTFKRSNGVAFANRQALINFYDSFISNIPVVGTYVAITDSNVNGGYATPTYVVSHGGGGSLAIGTPVTDGTPQNALYVGSDGKLADGAGMPIQVKVNQDDGTWTMGDIDGGLSGVTLDYSAENGTLAFGGEFTTGGAINANGGLTWNKAANTNTLPSGRAASGQVAAGNGDGSMSYRTLPTVAQDLDITGVNGQNTYVITHGQSFVPKSVLLIARSPFCFDLGLYAQVDEDATTVTIKFQFPSIGAPQYNFRVIYFP